MILDVLEAHEVPATFFVVGRRFANKNPSSQAGSKLLQEIAERGFTIGNHTSRHHRLDVESLELGSRSISQNAKDIEDLIGYRPYLFRPPFGVTTAKVRRFLASRNDTMVMWNIDPQDFQRTEVEELRKRVVEQILRSEGGVIVLHDTKPWTAAALDGILLDLEAENCRRLESNRPLLIPVSLHYFLRDRDGSPRAIPPETVNNTQTKIDSIGTTCKKGN